MLYGILCASIIAGNNVSLNITHDSLSVDYANKSIYLTQIFDKFLKNSKIVVKCPLSI